MTQMKEAILELMETKGLSEDSIKQLITSSIKAAYKKTFGTADNCIVQFADDLSDVKCYSRKTIVDGVYDPVTEMELEEAKEMSDEAEEGDEIDIELDPHTFERSAVSTGKQAAHQELNESSRDVLVKEMEKNVGQVIICYYQREYNETIYLNCGKYEGKLPRKYRSPSEEFDKNERIKAVVLAVQKTPSGAYYLLSRTDPKFVQNILELEVPEIGEGIIGVQKIVREPGYRTKIAVFTNKEDVDPVGACVGLKGVRIQAVTRELNNERIDVIPYDANPAVYIKNALGAQCIDRVIIMDEEKRQALAVVSDETKLSLAIGMRGQNVRLANRLCDWSIDVKTEEQVAQMDPSEFSNRKAAENLFAGNDAAEEEPISTVSELPGVDADVAAALKEAGYDDIQVFVDGYEAGSISVEGVTQEQLDAVNSIVNEVVEFVEEDEAEETAEASEEAAADDEAEEEYHCPECGAKITLDMTKCPNCGVEFEFE